MISCYLEKEGEIWKLSIFLRFIIFSWFIFFNIISSRLSLFFNCTVFIARYSYSKLAPESSIFLKQINFCQVQVQIPFPPVPKSPPNPNKVPYCLIGHTIYICESGLDPIVYKSSLTFLLVEIDIGKGRNIFSFYLRFPSSLSQHS